jgi:hypothetical protein
LQTLPDALLRLIAEYLKAAESITGIQLASRWALDFFSDEIKKVVLWSKPLLEKEKEKKKPKEKEQVKEKEQETDLTYSKWVMQQATAFLSFMPGSSTATPPADPKMEEKRRKRRWLLKYAIVLSYFLARFPNLKTLQGDVNDEELGTVLVEVFKRKAFPTVERFEDITPGGRGVFFGQVPFSILARALPNLRAFGFDDRFCFLDVINMIQIRIFFRAFGKGMFPKVEEIQLRYYLMAQQDTSRHELIAGLLVTALEARERLGGFPCLTKLAIVSAGFYSPAFARILTLESCSKLQSIQHIVIHSEHAPSMQEAVASYMRRTQCHSLESVSIGRCLGVVNGHLIGDDDAFGPIAGVIRSGMATNLKRLVGRWMQKAALEELSDMVQAGLLPNLKELVLFITPTNAVNLTTWTNGVLSPIIETLCLMRDQNPPLAVLDALHYGAFPNIKNIYMDCYEEAALEIFIDMLRLEGIGGAHTLRGVLVGKETSEKALQQLRALLPAAEVQRGLL